MVHVLALIFSVLTPTKLWYAADQSIIIHVAPPAGRVTLVLTDFNGSPSEAKASDQVDSASDIDISVIYPTLGKPDTYLLYAVPQGKGVTEFVGTPLLINVRGDTRPGAAAGAMVRRIEPLRYAVLAVQQGEKNLGAMTLAFYYDVAPTTIDNFLRLADGGFYDGLPFFRVVPDYVAQSGDPRGDGTGGPGYAIDAEFSDRKHEAGVLSMARAVDPFETANVPPRPQYANSAGSQFFICLNYDFTRRLDGVYTAFGRVVEGMDVLQKISAVATPPAGVPSTQPASVIKTIDVKNVDAAHNPYQNLLHPKEPNSTTRP